MLHSIKSLNGFTISATDGEIGKVKDLYFDDHTWKVRYLIVETGNWLFGRKVLLSPVAFQKPDWTAETFPVNLTKDQIRNSPDIDTEKPVSRQQEADLYDYYSWPYNSGSIGYMSTGMIGGVLSSGMFDDADSNQTDSNRDPHLRSIRYVTGYNMCAEDGEIGKVEDFLMGDSWNIPFAVIQTGDWYSGDRILIRSNIINKIEWQESLVYVDKTRGLLKNIPNFRYERLDTEEFENIALGYQW